MLFQTISKFNHCQAFIRYNHVVHNVYLIHLRIYSHYQSLWEDEKRRLKGLLRSKPISPPLPLVVICPVPANENVDENFVQRCLNIDDLVDEKLISCMTLYVIEYDEDLPEGVAVNDPEVTEKVRWKERKALYQWIQLMVIMSKRYTCTHNAPSS